MYEQFQIFKFTLCVYGHMTYGHMTYVLAVSEIKLFDYAPAGCTPSETVHPGTSPCTLLICRNDKWLKKCARSGCTSLKIVHLALKMCTPGAGCMLNFGHCIGSQEGYNSPQYAATPPKWAIPPVVYP